MGRSKRNFGFAISLNFRFVAILVSVIILLASCRAPDIDAPPILIQMTPIASPTKEHNPSYVFNSSKPGIIRYSGDCSSTKVSAVVGNNYINFNYLLPGPHTNCGIQVVDDFSNISDVLKVNDFIVDDASDSIAHAWNEQLLIAIRLDRARPPVQARNLFHTSASMYDIWSVFNSKGSPYLLGQSMGGNSCKLLNPFPINNKATIKEAISFAMYRLIDSRFRGSPGYKDTKESMDSLMQQLGYDTTNQSSNYASGSAAAFGNYVAKCYLTYGLSDGSNESGLHANLYYKPVNPSVNPKDLGANSVVDLDRWQPLAFDSFVDQNGRVIGGGAPPFLGAEWGNVIPFSLTKSDLTVYHRDSNSDGINDTFNVYHDPGLPPSHLGATSAEFAWNYSLVAKWSSQLDANDAVVWDISPASIGVDPNLYPSLPKTFNEYKNFYDENNGGDHSGGHRINPKTGLTYTPQRVKRGDYTRVLAEFWADGPNSETPPGHWFAILNYVTSQIAPADKRFGNMGPVLDNLEWDVKSYFALGGAMHDAAIAAWGIKGWYDYARPITIIRNLDKLNIPVQVGLIEKVSAMDPLAQGKPSNVGKIKIRAWRGPTSIVDPNVDTAGVGWILAENWWPYQRPTFVTPPFAGYVSGHSTFSRAGADILAGITGDPFFPHGVGEFKTKKNEFLVFEQGPTEDIRLEWATYRDAADQCSLSRIWGGIHPPFDDIPGREIGSKVASSALTTAKKYFEGFAEAP